MNGLQLCLLLCLVSRPLQFLPSTPTLGIFSHPGRLPCAVNLVVGASSHSTLLKLWLQDLFIKIDRGVEKLLRSIILVPHRFFSAAVWLPVLYFNLIVVNHHNRHSELPSNSRDLKFNGSLVRTFGKITPHTLRPRSLMAQAPHKYHWEQF